MQSKKKVVIQTESQVNSLTDNLSSFEQSIGKMK